MEAERASALLRLQLLLQMASAQLPALAHDYQAPSNISVCMDAAGF